ncbi:hypothetical protein ASPVEDRAFT_79758 [Aspergillus versicolor CBS 583.65]|uniref:Xylanolytic transcriptional activator regulatory domain-containing protein n=1 Tax=Aspergillus versicolor CBS 583.65 TaxID=1036611 RepID=A0A1L9P9E0_ASPVE|nr:uncharacterized protein ASPVEDRAFT_79758 [Aspergillus versicolor CBS 583.65]OJI98092.1 hypothetical protein ASPVEDRAFT_79758 [Aspergillus versicolor CBS 583.65]
MTTLPSPSPLAKKYVTRACDICKKRKCKCDGLEMCITPTGYTPICGIFLEVQTDVAEIDCSYNTSYKRVKRPRLDDGQVQAGRPPSQHQNETICHSPNGTDDARLSTEIEGDDGDASTHAFLKSVYTHLQSMGQVLPRNLHRPAEQILEGDSPASIFFPLERHFAQEYIDCFYEHSNATYRYIPRSQIEHLLDGFYAQEEKVLQDDAGMAVLLLVMAIGCVWLASWRNLDLGEQKTKGSRLFKAGKRRLAQVDTVYPPTTIILQGHVLECQFYLALNMFNTAWISLGNAIRLGQMAGFQRAIKQEYSLQEWSRRGIFWSLYMMDRYLSAALGRPMALDDSDITLPYPRPGLEGDLGKNEVGLTKGVVSHIKLTQITGKILKQLYPADKHSRAQKRDDIVNDIEHDLQIWLEETPSFFHPKGNDGSEAGGYLAFFEIPWIFKRQQRTVRAAFNFTTILLYRGYLLDEFLQPNVPRRGIPSSKPAVEKCVEAALRLASFAADIETDETYNSVYWVTTHLTFCAISILTVYMTLYNDPDQQRAIETVLEKAMRGHRKLDNSINNQSQRLLEESRSIAQAIQASPEYPSRTQRQDITALHLFEANSTLPIDNDVEALEGDERLDSIYNESGWDPQGYANILHGEGLGVIMNIGFDTSLSPLNDILPP